LALNGAYGRIEKKFQEGLPIHTKYKKELPKKYSQEL
tara:strand:- start:273 stop:383 length:111 start_codon:yes stop_codon:yes gene_type:complete